MKDMENNWIKLSQRIPNVIDDGEKLLVYRILNNYQKLMSISILDTLLVKHCNPDETWYMPLPAPPKTK